MPHVAFEVDNVYVAIKGRTVVLKPNNPVDDVVVAFIMDGDALELSAESEP